MRCRSFVLVALIMVLATGCVADVLVCPSAQNCLGVDAPCPVDGSNSPKSPTCVSKKSCCIGTTCVGAAGQTGACQDNNDQARCTAATETEDCWWDRGISVCTAVDQAGLGVCATKSAAKSPCKSNTDCLSEICDAKKCSGLPAGSPCDQSLQPCEVGLYCSEANICTARLPNGASCQYHPGENLLFSDVADILDVLMPSQCQSGYCKPGAPSVFGVNGTCEDPFQMAVDQPCESAVDCQPPFICSLGVDLANARLTPGFCESWTRPLSVCTGTNQTDPFPPEAGVRDPLCTSWPEAPTSQSLLCGCDFLSNDKAGLNFPLGACMPDSFSSLSGCFQEISDLRACALKKDCDHMSSFEEGGCMDKHCNKPWLQLTNCVNTILRVSSPCADKQAKSVKKWKNNKSGWEEAGDWLRTKSAGVPNAAWIGIGIFGCCVMVVCFLVLTIALSLCVKKIRERDY